MTASPLLSVRNLGIRFRQGGNVTTAVEGASFEIERGETVALVGKSGSGKSVTALSIMRLLPPSAEITDGEILFKGKDLLKARDRELREVRGNDIGIVFQEPMTSLNPLHTIERQVGEVLKIHQGLSDRAARKRTLELLEKVGIREAESRLGAYPHQLSGGQRQRVMIAMALANEPDLFIADEPTTALDVTVQAQILKLLRELQRETGMAVLFITHDLGIVRRMAKRVCVMTQGRIVEQGATETIFKSPQHPYTQHLLAAEPKGDPPQSDATAPIIMAAADLKVWFPIKRGFLRRVVGNVKAVDGVDVAVRRGQTLGVVGESGSGKTTLGLALMRLISSEGRIVFLGNPIESRTFKDMRPLRSDMQIVFQDPFGSLSPRMSIADIVGEGLKIHFANLSAGERDRKVVQALEEVGLDPATRNRYPHEFSGGQRQRIAVARAMVLEPKFVMLDEPTSALDMSVQAQVVDLLRDLQRRHDLAYLFISHDLKVVRALANDIVVMRAGKVVEKGPAARVFDTPETDYTKALIAAAFQIAAAPEGVVADYEAAALAKPAILIASGPWPPEPWAAPIRAADPERPVFIWPDLPDPASIRYALVWKPPVGLLATLPNLAAIFSLGAGVDHFIFQDGLPDVPIVRVVSADLTQRMTEWVTLQVLMHHRRQRVYDAFQAERRWHELRQPVAADVRVGIMGLGVLGRDAADVLIRLGFAVAGWSRRPATVPGAATFHGGDGLGRFLARTDILVCLLPLTPATRGVLSMPLFARLARDRRLGRGPIVINAGRGGLQIEADIVAAIEEGILGGASLDVFEEEPLDPASPLWRLPNVVITPHAAAASDAATIAPELIAQIMAHEAGAPLANLVDRAAFY